jgi:predicted DNA-binding transcriptional regulator AlpA
VIDTPPQIRLGDDPDRLLSYSEFAAWAGVPERTARSWVAAGVGPRVVRLGRHVRIRAIDALAWLDTRYETAAA